MPAQRLRIERARRTPPINATLIAVGRRVYTDTGGGSGYYTIVESWNGSAPLYVSATVETHVLSTGVTERQVVELAVPMEPVVDAIEGAGLTVGRDLAFAYYRGDGSGYYKARALDVEDRRDFGFMRVHGRGLTSSDESYYTNWVPTTPGD
jgi:hypothetical protein